MADRTNESWLQDLRAPGEPRERALADLGAILRAGLPYALSSWLPVTDPGFDALADDVVQDTLVRVLDRLDTFEGRSKFTTWAQKVAVRIALSELRRKRWQDHSLDEIVEDAPGRGELMSDPSVTPEQAVVQADLLRRVRQIIEVELTEKQRSAMLALGVQGMPADVVAHGMGMTRNALYKLMHDARVRLKGRLAEDGLDVAEVLAAFGNE